MQILNKKIFSQKFLILFILIVCSLAGIPPLPGFFSKLYILLYAFSINQNFIIIIGLLVSGLSAYYYLRILKIIFLQHRCNYSILKYLNFSCSRRVVSS